MTRLLTMMLCVLLCTPCMGQDEEPEPQKEDSKTAYVVVDVNGSLQLVEAKGLKAFKKKLGEAHKEALKEHSAAKKEARANKEKFTEPKPKAPKMSVLTKKPLLREQAEAALAKITEERRKAAEKAAAKKSKKGKK